MSKARLLAAKDELEDLPIPDMKLLFIKLDSILEVCTKSKGGPASINTFVNLLTRLIDEVFNPILNEQRRETEEQRQTGALTVQIQTLFTDLCDSFPTKRQLGGLSWDRIVYGADEVSAQLAIANPKIETALQNFKVSYLTGLLSREYLSSQ
ncbi:hypothetical protein FRC02_011915 [Tulasnella sp. 418]|nr:hypothetical protein FRC02_011915 [Tulasnella sp. 418]